MISPQTARMLMIEKQGFNSQLSLQVTKNDLYLMVDKLGCIQIDAINVVERAHYLSLWARLGYYKKNLLDALIYQDRLLFEHWAYKASIIPLKDYRYYIYPMKDRQTEITKTFNKWSKGDPRILYSVLDQIRNMGPLSVKNFVCV